MVAKSPILVFQHMPGEHLGYLFDLARTNDVPFQIVRLDLGQPIPDLRSYRALWVLGGTMDVWEEASYPWLAQEKRAIREAVFDLGLPYFGVCLGHQLLAEVLGGEVGPAEQPEIGVVDVQLSQSAATHPLLLGFQPSTPLVQWHLAEVKHMPAGIDILATSDTCPIHGITLNDRVLSLQSHIEVSMDTVREWLSSSSAQQQLEQYLGPNAVSTFEQSIQGHMDVSNQAAKCLFSNFMKALDEN